MCCCSPCPSACLAAITYFSVTAELSREFHTRILTESNALQSEFHNGGVAQLLRTSPSGSAAIWWTGLDYSLVG